MANIRGQIRTKAEMIKEETEAFGTVIESQNMENICGHRPTTKKEMIKEETEAGGIVIEWQNKANTALEVPRGPKWSQNKKSLGLF
jgi:hypothetical protein